MRIHTYHVFINGVSVSVSVGVSVSRITYPVTLNHIIIIIISSKGGGVGDRVGMQTGTEGLDPVLGA